MNKKILKKFTRARQVHSQKVENEIRGFVSSVLSKVGPFPDSRRACRAATYRMLERNRAKKHVDLPGP